MVCALVDATGWPAGFFTVTVSGVPCQRALTTMSPAAFIGMPNSTFWPASSLNSLGHVGNIVCLVAPCAHPNEDDIAAIVIIATKRSKFIQNPPSAWLWPMFAVTEYEPAVDLITQCLLILDKHILLLPAYLWVPL
jgi:hypothetical protein